MVVIPETLRIWNANQGGSLPCFPPRTRGPGFLGPVIFITGDMFDLAQRLAMAGHSVGLMNMANPTRPGGGFCAGCRAQEEEFCRRADLFARLMAS